MSPRPRPPSGQRPFTTTTTIVSFILIVITITPHHNAFGFTMAGARYDLLYSLGQKASSPSTTPKDLGTGIIDSITTLEKDGKYITRTELECILRGCPHPRSSLRPIIDQAKANLDKDVTSSYSYQVLHEALMEVPSKQALNLWRRNVALRQNRVLMPARAADLYALMINTCLAEGEWELPQQ